MVDGPVEATLDTIYSWTQYFQRTTQSTYTHLKIHAEQGYDTLSQIINSQFSSSNSDLDNINPFNQANKASIIPWKSLGLLLKTAKEHKSITISTFLTTLFAFKYTYSRNLIPYIKPATPKKRRATRLPNGARKDVILIIGNITDPITRYLAQDLEIRGFIVYITSTNTSSEIRIFEMDSYSELKPLIVRYDDWEFNRKQLLKLHEILISDHFPFPGAKPNKLNLSGVIVMNELTGGSGGNVLKGKYHILSTIEVEKYILSNVNYLMGLFHSGLLEICGNYEDCNIVVLQGVRLELPFNLVKNLSSDSTEKFIKLIKLEYPDLSIKTLKISGSLLDKLKKAQRLKGFFYKVFDMVYVKGSKWKLIKCSDVQFIGTGARLVHYFKDYVPTWFSSS